MTKYTKILFRLLFIAVFVFTGCVETQEVCYKYKNPVSRTLFIYMAADNSLGYLGYDDSNIEKMVSAATPENFNGGKIIIYHDRYEDTPQLLEISVDDNCIAQRKVLKEYGESNSADPQVYLSAIRDMQEYAPAESYGLVLWSHGTGWMPAEFHGRYTNMAPSLRSMSLMVQEATLPASMIRDPFMKLDTRAILQDGSGWSGMETLAGATPAGLFDFIMFDICLMGGAETAYAFAGKTDYLVISPAEVLADGMPYDLILKYIFADTPKLGKGGVCEEYFNYYNSKSGEYKSATTALYNCNALERLAGVMQEIISANGDKLPDMDVSGVQAYDRYSLHTMFDIRDVVASLLESNDPLLAKFEASLAAAVPYKATTGRMVKLVIDPDHYSGMSVYVPLESYDDLNASYAETSWYKRVYR